MKKLLFRLVAILLILIMALFLARNFIAREAIQIGAKKMTGFPLTIGSVDLQVFSSKVDVHDIKLMNPAEFPDPLFVDMPELYIDYQLISMVNGAPHINDMLINIKQLVIVKNKADSNVQKLKGVISSGSSGSSSNSTKYTLDKLRINVGTVIVKDYSRGKPSENEIKLNLHRTFPKITDSTDIPRLVLVAVLGEVPDIGIDVNDLKKNLGDVTGQTLQSATNVVGGLLNNLQKSGSQQSNK